MYIKVFLVSQPNHFGSGCFRYQGILVHREAPYIFGNHREVAVFFFKKVFCCVRCQMLFIRALYKYRFISMVYHVFR